MFYDDNPSFSIIICMYQRIGNSFTECVMYIHTIYTYAFSPIYKWYRHIIINSICHFIKKVKYVTAPVPFVRMCPVQPTHIFIITLFSIIQKIIWEYIGNAVGILA